MLFSHRLAAGLSKRGLFVSFLRDFFHFARPRAAETALFLLLGALLEGAGLLLLVPLLSVVLGTGSGSGWIDQTTATIVGLIPEASRTGQLAIVLGLFGLVIIARGLVMRRRDVLLATLQVGFVESHRLRIIELLGRSRWETTTRLQHGRIMHVLGGDTQACGDAASIFLQGIVAMTLLAGQTLLMLALSPRLALVILLLLGAGGLTVYPFLKRARRLGESLTDANLSLVNATGQFLGGLKLALSQDLQLSFLRDFQATLADAASRRVAFVRQRTDSQLIVTTAGALIASLVVLIGFGLFGATPATLLAFLFVLSRMIGPLTQVQLGAQHVFHSLPAYAKIKQLQHELASAEADARDPDKPAMPLPRGDIEFRDVTFLHDEGRGEAERLGGVRDLSIVLPSGAFIGLAGPSGSGKTTFCDLLVGLSSPRQGCITVGGVALEGAALPRWRASLSYVSQDPFLFHDTIRANLLWARPDAHDEAMWEALRMAGAEDFVRSLNHGIDTVVGERGGLVSGGERQRIAVARALLRKPKLLVLDEATNAIDLAGEGELLQRLSEMPNRPTIVMVAHRAASLRFCERMIELREGRLVQDS